MINNKEHFEMNSYSGEFVNETMNEWKSEISSPADTYIEWRFEQKCRHLSDGFRILTEWRKKKQQYISLMRTIVLDFQHYSRHEESHSICILERIEQILGRKRIDLLSAGDLWLLMSAAYCHDIGMSITHEQMVDIWDNDPEFKQYLQRCINEDMGDLTKAALFIYEATNLLHSKPQMLGIEGKEEIVYKDGWPIDCQYYLKILFSEYLRKYHAIRVECMHKSLAEEKDAAIPDRLYQLVQKVAQAHGGDFEEIFEKLKYRTNGFGNGMIHPQFAALMIRIGDLLDIDNNRFDPYAIDHLGRLPLLSLRHLQKHKAITYICVSEFEIDAEAEATEYEVALLTDEWFQSINREVTNLICVWNEVAPETLQGCNLKKSNCKVYLNHQEFDSSMKKEFSINKSKLIRLLIGTSIYQNKLEFIREYLQNAIDASKMQLWIDITNGKYELLKNRRIFNNKELNPFDLDKRVYDNYLITIKLDWNKNKDKILVQFIDRGIGIEKEYIEKLSNIGTGWRGRKQYQEELNTMAKWLCPTGGFGIGIQSAFMITDSVTMTTKSDKDAYGYEVILQNPDKGGTVTVLQAKNNMLRGTSISFEVAPEHFQEWSEWLKKQDPKETGYLDEIASHVYNLETWDEFDLDGILIYAHKFFEIFVKVFVPYPLFPVEITSPVLGRHMLRNHYWPDINYWDIKFKSDTVVEQSKKRIRFFRKEIAEEWTYANKEYLGIYVPEKRSITYLDIDEQRAPFFLVWNKTDCVLIRIMQEPKKRNSVCFKNILVRQFENERLGLFCRYSVYVDFMGFHVENHLKLHRNSFHEDFKWEKFCYEGFRFYLKFLWDRYEKRKALCDEWLKIQLKEIDVRYDSLLSPDMPGDTKFQIEGDRQKEKDDVEVALEKSLQQDYFVEEWSSYYIQLMRLIAFFDFPDSNYNFQTKKSIQIRRGIYEPVKHELPIETINSDEVLRQIWLFYNYLNNPENAESFGELPVLLLEEGIKSIRKNVVGISIPFKFVLKWKEQPEVYNERDATKISILFQTYKGIGIIADTDTITMLLSDKKLYTYLIKIEDVTECYRLTFTKQDPLLDKYSFYKRLWDPSAKMRVFITGENAKLYPELCVRALPFREHWDGEEAVHLIAPFSKTVLRMVQELLDVRDMMEYEEFRKLIFGERGSENPSYNMLINWVYEKQLVPGTYTKEKIKDAYEKLLKDLYKEYIYSEFLKVKEK